VVRRCVWSRNLKSEEATDRIGPQREGRGGGMSKDTQIRLTQINFLKVLY